MKNPAVKEISAKPALVPKLRFPEFRNQEGWKQSRLSEITSAIFDGTHQTPTYTAEGIPFYSVENLISGNANKFISREDYELATKKNKPEQGDILITRIGKIGHSEVVTWSHEFSIYVTLAVIKQDPRFNSHFLHHYLQSAHYQKEILSKSLLNAVPCKINMDSLRATHVLLASAPEQQKIADCLSSVDELIGAESRKLDALKNHKKGLMQQIFPREGETQPRLRFPEFRNDGEWSEGCIADIGTVLQGYGFPERHQGLKNGDYPFYKVSDISKSLAAGKVFIEESANYINESLLKELRAKPIPEGTTVFAKIGEAIRSNKRAITTVPCLIDNNAAGVKRIKGKATDFFIYLLMEQISLIDHAGGVVPAVNKSAIEAISVKFPGIDEQRRIADCLSSLDELIAAQTQKIEALKTHKKGLMQQLFPSPEEVGA